MPLSRTWWTWPDTGKLFLSAPSPRKTRNFVNLQEDSASTGDTLADLAGTKCASNKTYFKLGLIRPRKRYVAAKITRGSATATGPVYALLFKSRTPIASAATDPRRGNAPVARSRAQ